MIQTCLFSDPPASPGRSLFFTAPPSFWEVDGPSALNLTPNILSSTTMEKSGSAAMFWDGKATSKRLGGPWLNISCISEMVFPYPSKSFPPGGTHGTFSWLKLSPYSQ